jgi:peptidoglycan/xylan/chitin deacetylase (PgdA/CDA1 family)
MQRLKSFVAELFDLGINQSLFKLLGHSHIRAINYHDITDFMGFEEQLKYYSGRFHPVSRQDFSNMFKGIWKKDRPGMLISFDDGLSSHYEASKLLEKHGFTGWFFVPTGLIGKKGYLTLGQLKEMSKKHVIGSHTMTHVRLKEGVGISVMRHEIGKSRERLQKMLGKPVDTFCWVGGELWTYNKGASDLLRKHYDYAFQSNSSRLRPGADPHHVQRTNIESSWPLSLVRFQLSGIMDLFYLPKRWIVENRTRK